MKSRLLSSTSCSSPTRRTVLVAALVGAFAFLAPRVAFAQDEPRSLYVEGYAGQLSYAPGEEVAFHVSSSAPRYAVEIARIGANREVVWKSGDLTGAEHPVPENASSHGCGWPVAFKVPVGNKWKSGYYVATLRAQDSGGRYSQRGRRTAESDVYFVVRSAHPGRDTKILLQLATNTYNAYNNWGGFSLYAYNGRGKNQGSRVSFHRPGGSLFSRWEQQFVAWAERSGYVLDFAVNSDLEFRPELLPHYKLVLSVGHDEYWSAPMRDHLEAFIGRGGNVAFLSGNSVCWQVRSEDSGQALVCWKQNYHQDPVFATGQYATLTSLWSHHLIKRPENTMTGVGFLWGGYRKSHGQFMNEPAEFTVHRPEHWVFAGTDLKRGTTFGGKETIVGYECDGCELTWRDGLPYPTGNDGTPKNLTVLSTCPVRWHPNDAEWYEKWERGRTGNAVMGLYERGGTVFTAGTTDWSHGLGKDTTVDRITRNILDRLAK